MQDVPFAQGLSITRPPTSCDTTHVHRIVGTLHDLGNDLHRAFQPGLHPTWIEIDYCFSNLYPPLALNVAFVSSVIFVLFVLIG